MAARGSLAAMSFRVLISMFGFAMSGPRGFGFAVIALAALFVAPADAQTTGPVPSPAPSWRGEQSDPRRAREALPPREGAQRRPAPGAPDTSARKTPATPAERLDQLYGRLAKAKDEAEAQGVTRRIERLLARSASDTANLLMSRAIVALTHNEPLLAEDMLDRILDLEPTWAEAWARRAAIRTARDDISGAVGDFGKALALEPRHAGALSGLGFLLLRIDQKDEAFRVLGKALEINPHLEPAKKVFVKLTAERGGQEL